jgi:CDP-diacylglycerol---serine O-phosphatidyltransferase
VNIMMGAIGKPDSLVAWGRTAYHHAAMSGGRHFSMIRSFHVADALTLCNGACGAGSIFAAMAFAQTGSLDLFYLAALLTPLALLFDFLDGRVARWRHEHSALGRELDSLADVISFGVAPAVLGYAAGMQGALDVLVLLYFVVCGVSRLARFNVTAETLAAGGDKVKYFEGTPIPSSVLLVLVLVIAAATEHLGEALWLGRIALGPLHLHPLVLMFALSGSLMISKTLRIPKL